MKTIMKTTLAAMAVAVMATTFAAMPLHAEKVKGRVFCDGKAVAGVTVSDGYTVTRTDSKGIYRLDTDKDSRFIFITTPRGFISEPFRGDYCFYKDIEPSRKVYDFQLIKNEVDDTDHRIIAIADPQVAEAAEFPQLKECADGITRYLDSQKTGVGQRQASIQVQDREQRQDSQQGQDSAQEYDRGNSGSPARYTFGLCLGDITGYDHSLYEEYNRIMSTNGIRYRYVIGNHDMDNYGRSFETSTHSWEKVFGPTYYSFEVGDVHYIVLNDNFFIGKDWYYIGYLEEKQLKWMEKDLANVGTDKKVVVALHIPTTLSKEDRSDYVFNYSIAADVMSNKKGLYELLAPYDAVILSGHMHFGNNQIINDKLIELNIGALSGAWWCGDVCIDGAPAGFKVIDFNGTKVEWEYIGLDMAEASDTVEAGNNSEKLRGEAANGQVKLYVSPEGHNGYALANVWDYDPEWTVEYWEDGRKVCTMERITAQDPHAAEIYRHPETLKRSWVYAVNSENMFRAPISADAKIIEVRVTDRFGRNYTVSASTQNK